VTAALGTRVDLAHIGKWHLTNSRVLDPNSHGWPHYAGPYNGGAVANYFSYTKVIDGVRRVSNIYATTDQVNDAIGSINAARSGGRPFLIVLAFNSAHAPYHKPPNNLHSYDALSPSTNEEANPRPYYEAMIEAMDTEIGRLMRSIDLATTTVFFIGDNGTPAAVKAQRSLGGAKSSIYEGGIRVPLLIAGAGVSAPGRIYGHIVNSVDLFPTILEVAGINWRSVVPAGRTIDGVTLGPVLSSAAAGPVRKFAFSEHFPERHDVDYRRAIRNSR
jgi:arylsulfatase A-like enzyme